MCKFRNKISSIQEILLVLDIKYKYIKIKIKKFSNVKIQISWIRVVMLAVYTMQVMQRRRKMFWWISISMSLTYNQCQGMKLNHSSTENSILAML